MRHNDGWLCWTEHGDLETKAKITISTIYKLDVCTASQ